MKKINNVKLSSMKLMILHCFIFTYLGYADCIQTFDSPKVSSSVSLGGKIVAPLLYNSVNQTLQAASDDSNYYLYGINSKKVDKLLTGSSSVSPAVATAKDEVVLTNVNGTLIFTKNMNNKIQSVGKPMRMDGRIVTAPISLNNDARNILVVCQDGGVISCVDAGTKVITKTVKIIEKGSQEKNTVYCNSKRSENSALVTTDHGDLYSINSNCEYSKIYKSPDSNGLTRPLYFDEKNKNIFIADGKSMLKIDSNNQSSVLFETNESFSYGITKDSNANKLVTTDTVGNLYVFSENGEITEKRNLEITAKIYGKPLVTDSYIAICAEDKKIHFFDKINYRNIGTLGLHGSCRSAPVELDNGNIAVGTLDGYIEIINPPTPMQPYDPATKSPCDLNKELGALENKIDNTAVAKESDAELKSGITSTSATKQTSSSGKSIGGN